MRTFEEILETATEGVAFSNMSMYEHWAWNYCRFCKHGQGETECDVAGAAFIGVIPAEWTRTDNWSYECSEFDHVPVQED
jgi:hypothetical protein